MKTKILKALTLIWACIAGTLSYYGTIALIAPWINSDGKVVVIAFVPALITSFTIALKLGVNN